MSEAQILVDDKWGTWLMSGENLEEAALKLVTERLEQGFWYDNWDEGNSSTQWEDRAKKIVEDKDGKTAWDFLEERNDFEYERVEIPVIK